ncbi:CTQ-dependent lysine 6-oxidase LodA [Colwellia sp. E2M01]|uniref:CTQ-dependent lysine 6-oxidase LodA n=1 Tax=Colwellia sp. E2M01 TaxID=2841561 RepID=UPI001C086759|nr:CTQ-dependent lysine 6-oxidase LodA [Colwellia sp. E2M01]MBU2872340.1 CTQ-dependent lysine 6-oxidase LodA [Colwellia sp. E2M01]
MELTIHPSVGISRLGNSSESFCLSPEGIGQLPYEADANGNKLGPIIEFKDEKGQIKRQGQVFKLYQQDGVELTLDTAHVKAINWTVHLANKKAAWYQYNELEGNLLYGKENSYANQKTPLRNATKKTYEERQKLIVDPGPREISGSQQSVGFDQCTPPVPANYPISYPNDKVTSGNAILTLGDLKTDDQGRLIVLGGYGHAGGDEPLISYGGSDTWHDDIADGPVYCTVEFDDGRDPVSLQAWVVVGSPDFAPEIVNISNLSDSMFDVAVRNFNLVPDMCFDGKYNEDYKANYQRDILPIVKRFSRYQWVANVQSMAAFSANTFDYTDNSEQNRANRENYCAYFREPDDKSNPSPLQPQQILFRNDFPKMPLNSGSNSVSNQTIEKFDALSQTQQFLLGQWAKGHFESTEIFELYNVNPLDQGSVGNCVGLPMCPGIEVTWSLQNPAIYSAPYTISDQKGQNGYSNTGLSPSRDECEGGGCEPGDLTKRMACPWQADFFQCTVQNINFTNPEKNKISGQPLPPTYYSYWWPPQSPWDVLAGETTVVGQADSHLSAGEQVNYQRGINSFVQMVEHWSALAFIRDQNAQDADYPYFTETERNNVLFSYKEVSTGEFTGNPEDNGTSIPVFYIESQTDKVKARGHRAALMVEAMESKAFKAIKVAYNHSQPPRSGRRVRR